MPAAAPPAILAAFRDRFGAAPDVIVRAPGRVNLIGEHTDYSGLPVLPIAIEQHLLIAARARDDATIAAVSARFEVDAHLVRDAASEEVAAPWHRYLRGALIELAATAPGRGADLYIGGDLPANSGLSSSSAFTVGVLAALSAAWGHPLEREDLAVRAIAAERHVGVETGGMDQAAVTFARAGHALRIDFDPPLRRQVPLPAELVLIVASSGVEAPKGGAACDAYNERVVGARLAAAMLADQVGLDTGTPPRLSDVSAVEVVEILAEDLPEKVSAVEVAHGVAVDVEHLVRLTAARFDHMAKVPVKRVARHILSEAGRVDAAEQALLAGDLPAFGKLLDASHDSLRQDFRCSTSELDRLCAAMRKAGALGARLTGAGFGGYALAATTRDRVDAVMAAAVAATGGPAFEVHASDGLAWL
ncbi:MAG: galactokinase [Chloroflexi bacterium]|nr:galactokinase [Chloroflexota bacterium]